jgi:phage terminase small subunit
LLGKDKIRARIAELRREIQESTMITAQRTLEELAKIGYMDVRRLFDEKGNLIPIPELDSDTAAAISSIEVSEVVSEQLGTEDAPRVVLTRVRKIRLVDKKGALDSMARHLGMFKDVVRLEVNPLRELLEYVGQHSLPLPAKP